MGFPKSTNTTVQQRDYLAIQLLVWQAKTWRLLTTTSYYTTLQLKDFDHTAEDPDPSTSEKAFFWLDPSTRL